MCFYFFTNTFIFLHFLDSVFAYKILSSLKKSKRVPEPSNLASTVSMTSTRVAQSGNAPDAETPESEDSGFKWSHRAILLIEEYRKREEDVISGKKIILDYLL